MDGRGEALDGDGSGDAVILCGSGLSTDEGAAGTDEGAADGRFASDGSHATTAPPTAAKTANATRPPVSCLFTLRPERFRRLWPAGFRLCAVTVVHDVIAM